MKTRLTATTVLAVLVWLLPSLASAEIIGFEGESGSTPAGMAAYRVQSDASALGGEYIDSDHRSMDGGEHSVYREYSVTLPAGAYDLWGRIYTPWDFSYDPAHNSDDGTGTPSYNNDSFYAPAAFGADPTFVKSNGWRKFDGLKPGNISIEDAYGWINLTDVVDINGVGQTEGSTIDPLVPTYTSAGGTETFVIKSREGGLRHDAWAFVTDGQMPTEAELNAAAIPEPSSLVLLLIGLAGIAIGIRRCR